MTYNEIKELLKSVRSKKSRLKALQEYIAEERALIEGVGAVRYDKVSVISSPGNSTEERYAKLIDKLARLEERFDSLFDEMCAEEDTLAELMQGLPAVEYEVVLNRYLRGISVRDTAKIMGYCDDTIKYHQRQAYKKMSKN